MEQMQAQAEHVGARMMWDHDRRGRPLARPFRLIGDGGTVYSGDTLVIATGAQAKWLNLPSEEHLKGKGVSACATCDGFFYRGKKVAVIGGGNTAVEEALYMTNHSHDVTLIHRRDSFAPRRSCRTGCSPTRTSRCCGTRKSPVRRRRRAGGAGRARAARHPHGEIERIDVDGGFVAIGHSPATELFKGKLALDEGRLYRGRDRHTRTSVPGVFACGDVMDKIYRQAVTAAGTGCMAALDAEKFLAEAEFEAD
jgi:thioredoxin reductase (NADPH)